MNMQKSFLNAWESLKNAWRKLIDDNPILKLIFLVIGFNIAWLMIKFPNLIFVILISILITFSSIVMFSKNTTGATITFMVSLLTIFSIEWDSNPGYKIIFFILYVCYVVLSGLVYSIKLASEKETILIQASGYLKVDKKELEKLFHSDDATNIDAIDKSKIIRFLGIRKLTLQEIKVAIPEINLIKNAFQIDSESASKHYFTLYQIMKTKGEQNINKQIRRLLDMTFIFPLEPKEVFELIRRTKSTLIRSKKDLIVLLNTMKDELETGKDLDEVIDIINSIVV